MYSGPKLCCSLEAGDPYAAGEEIFHKALLEKAELFSLELFRLLSVVRMVQSGTDGCLLRAALRNGH